MGPSSHEAGWRSNLSTPVTLTELSCSFGAGGPAGTPTAAPSSGAGHVVLTVSRSESPGPGSGTTSEVVVTNPGPATVDGWQIQFGLSKNVAAAKLLYTGVTATSSGSTVLFQPLPEIRVIEPGGTVSFSFTIQKAKVYVITCQIDGDPC